MSPFAKAAFLMNGMANVDISNGANEAFSPMLSRPTKQVFGKADE